jgi:hypothetical protein
MVVRTPAFVIARRVLGLVGFGPAPDAEDIEIAVLRRLMVVRRQVARPRYTPQERLAVSSDPSVVLPISDTAACLSCPAVTRDYQCAPIV